MTPYNSLILQAYNLAIKCYVVGSKKYLGWHKNSKTTEIYTHVMIRDLSKIKSPLDTIRKGGEK
ncbi:MAG: hypothetical protein U9O96_03260 [Candidatus Thermoplasmatota archaeon]|nr:hypothetical protein [Candidatus Thermoplasmatota archaeon]